VLVLLLVEFDASSVDAFSTRNLLHGSL
jgi:hypothetical protein